MFTGHYVTCTDNKGEIMTGRAGKKGKLNGQNLMDNQCQLSPSIFDLFLTCLCCCFSGLCLFCSCGVFVSVGSGVS